MGKRSVELTAPETLHLATVACLFASHWAALHAAREVPRSVTRYADQAAAALTVLVWGLVASVVLLILLGRYLGAGGKRPRIPSELFPLRGIWLRRFCVAAGTVVPALALPLLFSSNESAWANGAVCIAASVGVLWGPLFCVGYQAVLLSERRHREHLQTE